MKLYTEAETNSCHLNDNAQKLTSHEYSYEYSVTLTSLDTCHV